MRDRAGKSLMRLSCSLIGRQGMVKSDWRAQHLQSIATQTGMKLNGPSLVMEADTRQERQSWQVPRIERDH